MLDTSNCGVSIYRWNILVEAEQICWIILLLEGDEAHVVRTERAAHHHISLLLEAGEVEIATAIRELAHVLDELARPADVGLVVAGVLPVGLGVEQEGGMTAMECARPGIGARHSATDVPEIGRAEHRWLLMGVRNDSVDRRVVQPHEVKRLPVVAHAVWIISIERLLCRDVGFDAAEIDERRAEVYQGLQGARALLNRAGEETAEEHERAMVNLHGEDLRMGWHDAAGSNRTGLVRRRGAEVTIEPERLRHSLARAVVQDEDEHHLRPHRMQLVGEVGYDAKVAAAAAQPPEEVAILRVAGMEHTPAGSDDLSGHEVVATQAVFAAQPAEAATERQPRNAGA